MMKKKEWTVRNTSDDPQSEDKWKGETLVREMVEQ